MGRPLDINLRHHLVSKTALTCLFYICIARFSTTVLNMGIYPEVATYFGIAREINTYAGVLAMVALAVVAGKKPSIIDAKTFASLSAILLSFGCVILIYAISSADNILTIIGLCSVNVARNWTTIMLYAALSSLKSRKEAIIAVSGGVLAGFALYPLSVFLPTTVSIVAYCMLSCCMIYPLYRATYSMLNMIASNASPSDMIIMNPFSFLGPTHPILVAILLFNAAFGFSLSLNIQQTTPLELSIIGIVVVLLAIVILLRKRANALDNLFSLSLLLIIAGYVTSIAYIGSPNSFSNTILTAGSAIFGILVYLVISSIISRNPWGAISLASWTIVFGGLGTAFGADIGHALNTITLYNSQTAILLICIILMLFISYLWLSMRNFSFDKTVQGIVSIQSDTPRTIDERFENDVAALSKRHGLTDRETEILLLMAKGRNSVFLQKHFVVSKNTIKTHIKHIYRKLEVHSQQEVIDLIEQYRRIEP